MRKRFLNWLSRIVTDRPRSVLMAAVLLTVVTGVFVPQLEVLTSRTALYPKDMDVSVRFEDFLDNFGATRQVTLVLDGEPEVLAPFSDFLALRLAQRTDQVGLVFHRVDPEFLLNHLPLFIPDADMEKIWALDPQEAKKWADKLEGMAESESIPVMLKELLGLSGSTSMIPEKREDIDEGLKVGERALDEIEGWLDHPERKDVAGIPAPDSLLEGRLKDRGYLRSYDQRLLFLLVQPAHPEDDQQTVKSFVSALREESDAAVSAWNETHPKAKAPFVALTGLPLNNLEEVEAIQHDVVFTVAVAALAILMVIFLGLRSIRLGLMVFIPLLLAGVWNLGLAEWMVGHLTLLTSGFTAILFGVGVDYGIFLTRRMGEERALCDDNVQAIRTAVVTTGRTLLAAAGTTALAFLVLATLDFQGFAELGLVGGTGILFVLLATLTVLPALAVLFPVKALKAPVLPEAGRVGPSGGHRLGLVVSLLGVVLFVLAAWGATSLPTDFDVLNTLPSGSEAVHYQREMARRSDFQPEFVGVAAGTVEETRDLTRKLRALDTVSRVDSVVDLLPTGQEERLKTLEPWLALSGKLVLPPGDGSGSAQAWSALLDELLELVEEGQEKAFSVGHKDLVGRLDGLYNRVEALQERIGADPEALERLNAMGASVLEQVRPWKSLVDHWSRLSPLTLDGLPDGLAGRFQGRDGRLAIYVFPKESIYDMDFLDRLLGEIYSIAPEATGFPTTHQIFSRLVIDGFKKATMLAVLVVLLLLFVEFRTLKGTVTAFLPLLFGGVWMLGALRLMGRSLSYANIIALPLVIGMAVDYGVYLAHRLDEASSANPIWIVRRYGWPVIMAAVTTLAGVAALVLGQHQGVASLGEALVVGIVTSMLAAVALIPSLISVVRRLAPGKHPARKEP